MTVEEVPRPEYIERHPVLQPGKQREGDSTMSDPELSALEDEAVQLKAMGRFLEVGIYHGRTTALLAQIGPVVAVDWLKGNVELAPPEKRSQTGWDSEYQLNHLLQNLERDGFRSRILLLAGSSFDVLPMLRLERFALVLLDGDKSEASVYKDIGLAWPILMHGGTLFLDDYYAYVHDEQESGTVKRAWERFAKENALEHLQVDLIGFQPPSYRSTPKLARIRKPRAPLPTPQTGET